MVSLETLGYYTDALESQLYPPGFAALYPDQGNFVAFVGELDSRAWVHRWVGAFRRDAAFPSEALAAPGFIPGIAWSDHWGFQRHGIPALMITDTAPYRYPHYHTARDTPDRLDYLRMARLTVELARTLRSIANGD